jgi:hypothetical protein
MSSSSNARTGASYDATIANLRRVLGGFDLGTAAAKNRDGD